MKGKGKFPKLNNIVFFLALIFFLILHLVIFNNLIKLVGIPFA